MSPLQMRILDRFELRERVGAGGMAVVYRTWDEATESEVALKVVYDHLRTKDAIASRLRKEVELVQAIRHPNVIRIFELVETEDFLCLVMEYHPGRDLKRHIAEHGSLAPARAREIALATLEALDAAHAQSIVHRDIKPHNVLIDDDGRIKVTDFGLAELDEAIDMMSHGTVMGTVEYMAPEQFENVGFGADARADLYALGVTLFEMLTGSLPYRADSPMAVMDMHRTAPIPDARVFDAAIPADLVAVIETAMAKVPEERFQSAQQMAEALKGGYQRREARSPHPAWLALVSPAEDVVLGVERGSREDWRVEIPQSMMHYRLEDQGHLEGLRQVIEDHSSHARLNRDYLEHVEKAIRGERIPSYMFRGSLGVDLKADYEAVLFLPVRVARGLTREGAERMHAAMTAANLPVRAYLHRPWYHRGIFRFLRPEDAPEDEVLFEDKVGTDEDTPWSLGLVGPIVGAIVILLIVASDPSRHEAFTGVMFALFAFFFLWVTYWGWQTTRNDIAYPQPEQVRPLEQMKCLLDFTQAGKPRAVQTPIGAEDLEIYEALTTARLRQGFQRIMNQILYLWERSNSLGHGGWIGPSLESVATRSRHFARHLVDLEGQVLAVEPREIFEKLSFLDDEIRRQEDIHELDALISRKTGLLGQLEELDESRRLLDVQVEQLLSLGAALDKVEDELARTGRNSREVLEELEARVLVPAIVPEPEHIEHRQK